MPFSTGDVRILETQHYGATTRYEYFATMSNAMWHFYGHYPWNRNELWRTDPETYSLIWNAWHDPDGFCEERRWRLHQNWTDDPVSSVESR